MRLDHKCYAIKGFKKKKKNMVSRCVGVILGAGFKMDLGYVVFLKPPRACRGLKKAENGDCGEKHFTSVSPTKCSCC